MAACLAIAIVLFCRLRSLPTFAQESILREEHKEALKLGDHTTKRCLLTSPIALVLSGCTSSSTTPLSLYLTSLSYQSVSQSTSLEQVNPDLMKTFAALVNGSSLEVRAGYFGLCVRNGSGLWVCSGDSTGLARLFQPNQDPLNLIWVQAKFREGIVFSGLM